jgi:hypothetical protein
MPSAHRHKRLLIGVVEFPAQIGARPERKPRDPIG